MSNKDIAVTALSPNITINFDSHITKVTNVDGVEWTTSGEKLNGNSTIDNTFTVTCESGYVIDTVTAINAFDNAIEVTDITDTTFKMQVTDMYYTITITSKQGGGWNCEL